MSSIIPVREEERFDSQTVEKYLRQHLSDLPDEQMEVQQFSAGHSNLTYLLTIGDWQGVLRRPPLGTVATKAHDMQREFNLLRTVNPYVPMAPKPYLFCSDESLIGASFYVMQRLSGVIFDQEWPTVFPDSQQSRRQVSESLIKTLASIHKITSDQPGIAQLGHPDGYLQRQVEGWIKRYQLSKTAEEIPGVRQVGRWLQENLPEKSLISLIHNDFKLNNVLFDWDDPSKIVGIVDWEMSTLGDPLSDLGITLSYWGEPDDPPVITQRLSHLTTQDGFLTRAELLELYTKETGRDSANMAFYMTFAYFKYAGILQQIYYRWWRGQTEDQRFAPLGELAKGLIQLAVRTTESKHVYD